MKEKGKRKKKIKELRGKKERWRRVKNIEDRSVYVFGGGYVGKF